MPSNRIVFIRFMCLVLIGLVGSVLTSNAQNQKPANKPREQLVTELKPVEGRWEVEKDVTINGQIYDIAGTMDVDNDFGGQKVGKTVFANRDGYTLFEAYVGFRGSRGKGTNQFVVLGDGEELFRSPKMTQSDPPIKISISIRGRKGITLYAYGDQDVGYYKTAVWAEPRFKMGQPAKQPTTSATPNPSKSDNTNIDDNTNQEQGKKVLRLDPDKLKELATDLKTEVASDPELKGRPTLAIAAFKLIPAEALAPSNADNVREDLSTALTRTKAFDVVERGQLDQALKELKISLKDTFDSATAQKLGKLVGARTVLIGSISDRGTYAIINVRLIDTQTGRVRIASQVELRQ